MKSWQIALLVALAGYSAACASAPVAPVPLVGAPADLSLLEGHWVGDYSSSATGREGTIVFDLSADADSAKGEVWMTAPGWRPMEAAPPYRSVAGVAVEVLTIRFVRVEGGLVSGTLDPYRDPETGLELVTTFRGRIEGNRIVGTFTTVDPRTRMETSGLWNAERRALAEREHGR